MTNVFLPRTNHVGSPWLSRSVVSGRARQSFRRASRGSSAMPYSGTATVRRGDAAGGDPLVARQLLSQPRPSIADVARIEVHVMPLQRLHQFLLEADPGVMR